MQALSEYDWEFPEGPEDNYFRVERTFETWVSSKNFIFFGEMDLQGRRDGLGIAIFPDHFQMYIGHYKADQLHGSYVIFRKDGLKFTGTAVNG